jgi:hypothetical protein
VKFASQIVSVCFSGDCKSTYARMYSFQAWMNAKIEVATSPGATRGSRIRRKAPKRVLPSTMAASSSSRGTPAMKPRRVHTQNGRTNVRYVMITPLSLFTWWTRLSAM